MVFYMLGVGLVAYLFHKRDKGSKDASTSKVERNKGPGQLHDKS